MIEEYAGQEPYAECSTSVPRPTFITAKNIRGGETRSTRKKLLATSSQAILLQAGPKQKGGVEVFERLVRQAGPVKTRTSSTRRQPITQPRIFGHGWTGPELDDSAAGEDTQAKRGPPEERSHQRAGADIQLVV